jgi:hypothetical protein
VASTDGSVLSLRGEGAEGFADSATGRAGCHLSADYLGSPDALRAEVIEPLVLYLVCRSDRVPVHASAFCVGDLAVLLAGPSGSGKSCLALAADAVGLAALSEDTTYLQFRPGFRAWGWSGPAHVLPANAPVGAVFPTRRRNGTTKYAVPLASGSCIEGGSASRAVLCILTRGDRVSLERLSAAEAMRQLEPLEPGFDLMADEVCRAHAALARKGAWQLTLSRDPGEAIRCLIANMPRLAELSVP